MKLTKNGLFVVAEFSPTNISQYQYESISYSFIGTDSVSVNVISNSKFIINLFTGLISGITDVNDTPYTQISLNAFFASFSTGGSNTGDLIFVDNINKLPNPVLGTYTLNESYFFTEKIDFGGANVVLDNAAIIGASQEKAGITNANVTASSTSSVNWIRFDECDILIDAIGGAFDLTKNNFYGCGYITIQNAANIILETSAFINSLGIDLVGTIDSLVLSPNCIFRNADISEGIPIPVGYDTTNFVNIASTAVINRRIRVQDSVFSTSVATQKAINFEVGASIPVESLILKTVSFNGIGTALNGINGGDDRASFFEVKGGNSINSATIGSMVMKDNTVATVVSFQDDRYKVAGTFEAGAVMQRFQFDAVNNALEYTSVVPRTFIIQAPFTVRNDSGSNVVIGSYLGVKKAANLNFDPDIDRISESEQYTTNSNSTRPDAGTCQAVVTLEQGDKIYLITQNKKGAQDIIHEFVNLIAQRAAI